MGLLPQHQQFRSRKMGRQHELGEKTKGIYVKRIILFLVFLYHCSLSYLSIFTDLEAAARVLEGRKVAPGVRAICTPGSETVKRAAEAEGLDDVFRSAGFEWREPGCSLCFNAGGEGFDPGERIVSSTNRNFRGRQGPMARTHLASPAMVAAAAVEGAITDCREFAGNELTP